MKSSKVVLRLSRRRGGGSISGEMDEDKTMRCKSYESDSSAAYPRSLAGGIEWIQRPRDGFAIGVHAGSRERSGTSAIGRHQ